MPRPMLRRAGAALAATVVLLAACSDGDDDGTSADTTGPASSTTAAEPDGTGPESSTSGSVESPQSTGETDGGGPTTTAARAGGEPAPVPFEDVELESTGCRFTIPAVPDGQEPECYWLTVPQDWDDPDETDGLRVHATVFGGASDGEPIVILPGGPGRAGLDELAASFEPTIAPLLDHGDVVLFDQRGSGHSEPALECPELLDAARTLDSPATSVGTDPAAPLSEAAAECSERLVEAGIELGAYTSIATAADVDALRDALGIEQWNVYGARYGTRLAQTYVRDFGDTVRSVVLDAPFGLDTDPLDTTEAGEAAIGRLFDDCSADTGCAERYPDLAQRFDALREQLDAEPLVFTSADIGSGGIELRADGQYLYETVLGSLRSRETLATVPRLIESVENGDSTIIEVLAALDADREAEIAFGQHLSVLCNEEAPFGDGTPDALYAAACPTWDSGAAPAIEGEAVTSDVPALILAGQFDTASPSADATRVGDGLTMSHFVQLMGVGGGALGNDCADSIVASFLADPTTAPDTACVDGMAPPVYVTGDVGTIDLEDTEVDFFGALVSTVRPAGWQLVDRAGGFVRARDVLDPTGIFTLAVPEVPIADVAAQLSGQAEFQLIEGPPLELGGRTWDRFDAETADSTLSLAGTIDDGTTIVVVLEALPDERDALVDTVLLPVLESIDVTIQ